MEQKRIKKIIEELSSKEFHNEESIRFSLLSIFASIPNFINCVPVCIEDIKYMIKGGKIFYYEIEEDEDVNKAINKFKNNWKEILEANIIIIINFSILPDIMMPLKALLLEENKNLFSVIAIDEKGFIFTRDTDIFKHFVIKTKIDNFSYMNKIERIVHVDNGENLYLPINESFTKEELRYSINSVSKVTIPEDIMECLKLIYDNLERLNDSREEYDEEIILSKDRWKEIISMLKASAFLNGRENINLTDLFILKKVLWSKKSHIQKINEIIHDAIAITVNMNCANLKIYSMEMIQLLIEMTRTFKLLKNDKDSFISNIDVIQWNASFDRIKNKILQAKYYSKDFFDIKDESLNIFIDECDEEYFINLFKIDDKLIFDWYKRLKVIVKYVNERQSWY